MLTVAALALVASRPGIRLPRDSCGAVAAGSASGFMNAAAGVGGPALVYPMSRRREHERFVATSQMCFFVVNAASVAARGLPRLPGWELAAAFAALGAAVALGHLPAGRAPAAPRGERFSRRHSPAPHSRSYGVCCSGDRTETAGQAHPGIPVSPYFRWELRQKPRIPGGG